MRTLQDKVVLLTGGVGSLGRVQAVGLAAEGAHVILLDRPDTEGPHEIAQALAAEAGGQINFFGCDLNDLEAAEAQVKALAESTGGIDVLINNAALSASKAFEDYSLAEYEEQVRVNSSAAFALSRACAPGMKAKGRGVIINFCSVSLNGRFEGYVPYVASKGAVLGLTKSLARELGPFGIRVNAVSPGVIEVEAEQRILGDRLEEFQAWVLQNQCLKVRVEPRHVSDLVLFLASPAASMITGQCLAIDGGW